MSSSQVLPDIRGFVFEEDEDYALELQMQEMLARELELGQDQHAPEDAGGGGSSSASSSGAGRGSARFSEGASSGARSASGGGFPFHLDEEGEENDVYFNVEDVGDIGMLCDICQDYRPMGSMKDLACSHSFCLTCLAQHGQVSVEAKRVPIPCPAHECTRGLSADECELFLEPEAMSKLLHLLAEQSIPDSERFFCPYRDCSMLMVSDFRANGNSVGSCAVCNGCERRVCLACAVPWHEGATCEEFQAAPEGERDPNDFKLKQLASSFKWRRCPKCRSMVERSSGCPHMTCRCKAEFCYGCGKEWVRKKPTCQCFVS